MVGQPDSSRFVHRRLGEVLKGLDLEGIIFPYLISGPLDAGQRLDFLRFHLAGVREGFFGRDVVIFPIDFFHVL